MFLGMGKGETASVACSITILRFRGASCTAHFVSFNLSPQIAFFLILLYNFAYT